MKTIVSKNDGASNAAFQDESFRNGPPRSRQLLWKTALPFIAADIRKFGSVQSIRGDGYMMFVAHSPDTQCPDAILAQKRWPAPGPMALSAWVTFDDLPETYLASHLYPDVYIYGYGETNHYWFRDMWGCIPFRQHELNSKISFEVLKRNTVVELEDWAQAFVISFNTGSDAYCNYCDIFLSREDAEEAALSEGTSDLSGVSID